MFELGWWPRTFVFKAFQREDYARAAMHDGVILGHDTGLGKTIAMFIWPLLKCGYHAEDTSCGSHLRPAKPVLLIVPGDGHDQTDDESRKHFKTKAVRLDSQQAFYRLAKPDPLTGRFTLPPNYYLTSYTQLTGNGVVEFPPLDRLHPQRTMSQLGLRDDDAAEWWNNRGKIYARHYERLSVTADSSLKDLEAVFEQICRTSNDVVIDLARESLRILKQLAPTVPSHAICHSSHGGMPSFGWERLNEQQQHFVRSELVITRHREFQAGIGESRVLVNRKIKCVYSPSLADLCQDCFATCVIDEGTKIKGDDTIIGTGVRQINAEYRLVLTATPIKNRFPDLFHLAHYVCGGHEEPTARVSLMPSSTKRPLPKNSWSVNAI